MPRRCDRTVSATSLRLGRAFEFSEEHLLQRQLVAVEFDHTGGGQRGKQRRHGTTDGAAHMVTVDPWLSDAGQAGEILRGEVPVKIASIRWVRIALSSSSDPTRSSRPARIKPIRSQTSSTSERTCDGRKTFPF